MILRTKDINKKIGKAIRYNRLKKGFSLISLASALKISPNKLKQYEAGTKKTTSEILYKISKVLTIEINTFFDKANIKKSEFELDKKREEFFLYMAKLFKKKKTEKIDLLISVIKNITKL